MAKDMLFMLLFLSCTQAKKLSTSTNNTSATIGLQATKFSGTDTMGYLKKDIIANKAKYINQPLQVLLSDLTIPVKSSIAGLNASNIHAAPTLTLSFIESDEITTRIHDQNHPPLLHVSFLNPASMDTVDSFRKVYRGKWSEDQSRYFGQFVITNVFLSSY